MATKYLTMRCSRCKQVTDDFNSHPTLGRQGYCRPCMKEYKATRRDRDRMSERKSKYGISEVEQADMFARQHGLCAACTVPLTLASAHLDHDHDTLLVRAFLCSPCNRTIGHAGENVARLLGCADYLVRTI